MRRRPPSEITNAAEARRLRVSELMLLGWDVKRISFEVQANPPVVLKDMRILRQRWQEQGVANIAEIRGRELARLDKIEEEAWEAWERSKSPIKRRQKSRYRSGRDDEFVTNETQSTESTSGDFHFLNIILECAEQRQKIFGLQTQKVALQGVIEVRDVREMTDDELMQVVSGQVARPLLPEPAEDDDDDDDDTGDD